MHTVGHGESLGGNTQYPKTVDSKYPKDSNPYFSYSSCVSNQV